MNDDSRPGGNGRSFLDKIAHFLSGEPQNKAELLEILRSAQENALIDPEAFNIINGAMIVSDMQVREIMVPRSQAVMIDVNSPAERFMPLILESAHSRYPVFDESRDEVVGILLAKDLLDPASRSRLDKLQLKDMIRPAVFVPESKRLNVLLREFRHSRTHMAIVLNEYGTMSGLVTIEDILEQIVGDIADEHDSEDDLMIRRTHGDEFVVKAVTPVEEFNAYFNTTLDDDDYDTIGGIVLGEFGRLPKRNESVTVAGHVFKVLHADQRSIKLLQVTPAE
jgi:magnesium and cobalt transporter